MRTHIRARKRTLIGLMHLRLGLIKAKVTAWWSSKAKVGKQLERVGSRMRFNKAAQIALNSLKSIVRQRQVSALSGLEVPKSEMEGIRAPPKCFHPHYNNRVRPGFFFLSTQKS